MFFKIFKNRFSFMINSLGFKFSFTAVLILCLYHTFDICYITRAYDVSLLPSPSEAFILTAETNASQYLLMFYIFILIFPFCFSYIKEKRLHINSVIVTRTNQKKYYLANLLCSFLGAFLIFLLPFLIEMLVNKIVFAQGLSSLEKLSCLSRGGSAAITGDDVIAEFNTVAKGMPLQWLYVNHPGIYNVLFAFLFSSFCGVLSAFVYSISRFFYRFSLLLFLPVYLLTFIQSKLDAIMDYNGRTYLDVCMKDYITVNVFYGRSYLYFFLLTLAIVIVIALIAIRSIKQDRFD